MKHVDDTQWVTTPTRERLAAARKRTLRSVAARRARSVWSVCRSRVIESRNLYRWGLPVCVRGGSTAMHTISHHRQGMQATCMGARPGSESGAKTRRGNLESWESRTVPAHNSRNRAIPAQQRPGAGAALSAAPASETAERVRAAVSEGNRSERIGGYGSLSCLIVALENRVTFTGGSL